MTKDFIQTGRCSCCHVIDPEPEEKSRVLREAMEVLAKITVDGKWYIRMEHNISWHYTLVGFGGRMGLLHYDGMFTTLFSIVPSKGSIGDLQFSINCRSFKNPNTAIRVRVKQILATIERELQNYTEIMKMLKDA